MRRASHGEGETLAGPGPRAGQPLRRLRSAAAATATAPRAARLEGFSLNGIRYDGSWDESDLLAAVEAAAA